MSKAIMRIGILGSGKTTILKPFTQRHFYVYINPDDICLELLGDGADQSNNDEVWREAYKRAEYALSKGKHIVFDGTFAKDFGRKDFIRFAREKGASKVEGAFTQTSPATAYERNVTRGRIVPRHAIERMNAMLKNAPPRVEDGFDRVFNINELENRC